MADAKIMLYEDENFGGRVLEVTKGIPKLSAHDFNDVVSSIKVEAGNWIVYDDEDYTGPSYKLGPGCYPNPKAWGGQDDELSSVKPVD